MKKLLLLFVCIIISCSFVFADSEPIKAEGRGKTEEEAINNARNELTKEVYGINVYSNVVVSTSDNGKDSSSSFSQESNQYSSGYLPGGVKTEIVSSNKDGYVATAWIVGDEATLKIFYKQLEDSKKSVEISYETYSSLGSSSSVTQRREKIEDVIENYYNYNNYYNATIRLGGDVSEYKLNIKKTLPLLQQEYESLVTEEENELKSNKNVTKDIQAKLDELSAARAESKKAQEEANEQAKLQRTLELSQALSKVKASSGSSTSSLTNTDSSLDFDSFQTYIEEIKDSHQAIVDASKQYEKLVSEQTAAIEKSYEEEAQAIWNRTYRLAEMQDGNPIDSAKEARQEEVDELREQKNQEKEEILEIIDTTYHKEIQNLYNYYIAAVVSFEEKEFYMSSKDGYALSADYRSADYIWKLSTKLFTNTDEILEISLSYKDLTGEDPQKPGSKKYNDYLDNVDFYKALLDEGKYEFSVEFNATVTNSGQVTIDFTSFNLQISENSIRRKLSVSSSYSLDFKKSDYLSYSWLKRAKRDKEKVKLGLSLDLQPSGTFGNLFAENLDNAISATLETRFFISKFFVSCSLNFSFWYTPELQGTTGLLQSSTMLGVGYRAFDRITFSARASYSKAYGLLINPYVSVAFLKTSAIRAEAFGGVYFNCKTGKVATSVGLDLSWRCF